MLKRACGHRRGINFLLAAQLAGLAAALAPDPVLAQNALIPPTVMAGGLGDPSASSILTTDQVAKAVMDIRDGLSSLDTLSAAEAAGLTDVLRDRYRALEALATSKAISDPALQVAIEAAGAGLGSLASEGLAGDDLAFRSLQIKTDLLFQRIKSPPGRVSALSEEVLSAVVEIQDLHGQLKRPGLRLEAALLRARVEAALGNDERILRIALVMREEIDGLSPNADSDDKIEQMARLIWKSDIKKSAPIVARLLESLSDKSLGEAILRDFASAQRIPALQRSGSADAFFEMLKNTDFSNQQVFVAIINAQDRAADRDEILEGGLAVLLGRNAIDLAMALRFLDVESSDSYLRKMAAILSARGRALVAVDVVQQIIDRRDRLQGLATIAGALADKKYVAAAAAALEHARKALDDYPSTDAGLAETFASVYRRIGDERSFAVFLDDHADILGPAADLERARLAFRKKDFERLLALLKGMRSDAPVQSRELLRMRTAALLGLGRIDDAAEAMGRFLEQKGTRTLVEFGDLFDAAADHDTIVAFLAALHDGADERDWPLNLPALEAGAVAIEKTDPGRAASSEKLKQIVAGMIAKDVSAQENPTLVGLAVLTGQQETPRLLRHLKGANRLRMWALYRAQRGAFATAYDIVDILEPGDARDRILAAVAERDAERGDPKRAAQRLTEIGNSRLRVRSFLAVAKSMAAGLDLYGFLDPLPRNDAKSGVSGSSEKKGRATTADKVVLERQPESVLRSVGRFSLVEGPAHDLGISQERRPPLKRLHASADDVRAMVPARNPLFPRAGNGGLIVAGANRFAQLDRFTAQIFKDVVGTNGRETLYSRQNSINPLFLHLDEGVFTGRQLQEISLDGRFHVIEANADGYLIRAPILIGPDATLVLSGQEADKYRLSASNGAFIVNAGKLFIVDTVLEAYDEVSGKPVRAEYKDRHDFRPFIVSWSDSETHLAGSRFVGLGYSAAKSYGLSISTGPGTVVETDGVDQNGQRRPVGTIVENSFDNMLYGFYSYEADDVIVLGNEYRNNIYYGLDPHDRSKNLMLAYNTGYGTLRKHGGIISREVDNSFMIGNLMFDNRGSGLMVDRDSVGTLIYANTAFDNDQDGLTLFESACTLVQANDFSRNRRDGIKVRNSWDVNVLGNRIVGNDGAGVHTYISRLEERNDEIQRDFARDPYAPVATLVVSDNTLAANAMGISARGASSVTVGANIYRDQSDRIFDGDLKSQALWIYRYASKQSDVTLNASCVPKVAPTRTCRLFEMGLLGSHTAGDAFSSSGEDDFCLSAEDSVQAGAIAPAVQ